MVKFRPVFAIMAKIKHFNIAFPITRKSEENTFFDLNGNTAERIKSQLMHAVFTPRGQRLRRPEFGSNLIQFIFEPNDTQSYGDVIGEIKEMVSRSVPNCNLDNIDIYETDNGLGLLAKVQYSVKSETGENVSQSFITKL